jgi:hypothetical protein
LSSKERIYTGLEPSCPPNCAKSHNFKEREYDFDELEKILLAASY